MTSCECALVICAFSAPPSSFSATPRRFAAIERISDAHRCTRTATGCVSVTQKRTHTCVRLTTHRALPCWRAHVAAAWRVGALGGVCALACVGRRVVGGGRTWQRQHPAVTLQLQRVSKLISLHAQIQSSRLVALGNRDGDGLSGHGGRRLHRQAVGRVRRAIRRRSPRGSIRRDRGQEGRRRWRRRRP